jgi:hypothetical protein
VLHYQKLSFQQAGRSHGRDQCINAGKARRTRYCRAAARHSWRIA